MSTLFQGTFIIVKITLMGSSHLDWEKLSMNPIRVPCLGASLSYNFYNETWPLRGPWKLYLWNCYKIYWCILGVWGFEVRAEPDANSSSSCATTATRVLTERNAGHCLSGKPWLLSHSLWVGECQVYPINCESGGLAQPKEWMVAIAMGDRERRKQLSGTIS